MNRTAHSAGGPADSGITSLRGRRGRSCPSGLPSGAGVSRGVLRLHVCRARGGPRPAIEAEPVARRAGGDHCRLRRLRGLDDPADARRPRPPARRRCHLPGWPGSPPTPRTFPILVPRPASSSPAAGLRPVHLGLDERAQGRDDRPRHPHGQPGGHPREGSRARGRHDRELAAALSRHGAGHTVLPVALPGRPARPDAPAPFPSEADPRGLRAISTHCAADQRVPNFALRPLRPFDSARGSRRTGPGLLDRAPFARPSRSGAETLDRFAEASRPAGFRREAFYPCYGLAEATVFVTGVDRRGSPSYGASTRIRSSGGRVAEVARRSTPQPRRSSRLRPARPGTRIAIVDPATLQECPPNRFGEIWVAGPGVGRGYWGKPDASAETFEGADREPGAIPPDRRPGVPEPGRIVHCRAEARN